MWCTHLKACLSDALDDVVDLTLVPAWDGAERGYGFVDGLRRSGANLALSQTDALVAQCLDGIRGDGAEVGYQSCCNLSEEEDYG